ncbi:MAG: hypothetical protein IPN71_00210 [Fibrobacteres bacterium]|nr:hypothetical protein [Fibrobacterota bacterium]
MKRLVLAFLLPLGLEGCFSSMLIDDIKSSRGREHMVLVKPASGNRVQLCPRVGKINRYRFDAESRPMYLDLDGLVLSDEPRRVSPNAMGTPAPLSDTLEVVVGESPEGFFPSDLEGSHPSVFLRIPIPKEEVADTGMPMLSQQASLLVQRHGQAYWLPLDVYTNRYDRRCQQAYAVRKSPWFLVAVPADVVSSPLQLFLWYVFKDAGPFVCSNGCH